MFLTSIIPLQAPHLETPDLSCLRGRLLRSHGATLAQLLDEAYKKQGPFEGAVIP